MKYLITAGMLLLLAGASPADTKLSAARELAELVARKFGKQAAKEGTEVLTRKIESAAAKHGAETFGAVRNVGSRAISLADEAGEHGATAMRAMARHGEGGAAWIVARPSAMKIVAKHGDEAGEVLVKHAGGIAEPVIEGFGKPAVMALASTGAQGGRRICMMAADGDLVKIGRTPELLEVIAKYGDRAAKFVWENKGALLVAATLTAFLADPEPFLNTAEGITQTVAENVARPLAEIPGKTVSGVVQGTNWTVIFGLLIAAVAALTALLALKPRFLIGAGRAAMAILRAMPRKRS